VGELLDIGDIDVRLFQTVPAGARGGRCTSSPTSVRLSLFSLTSSDVAGRRCALTLPLRSMLGKKNRRSDLALAADALWKQLELLERMRRGAEVEIVESDDVLP